MYYILIIIYKKVFHFLFVTSIYLITKNITHIATFFIILYYIMYPNFKIKKVTRKRKGGKKNKNCKTQCKTKFTKEIKQHKKYKAINKIASFFNVKKYVDDELNNVLDSKDIQNNEVFKDCLKKCKK